MVDDDPDLSDALATALMDEGYGVAMARDGRHALEHLRNNHAPPDLILLDLMMPGMDGYTFRAEQRADPALAEIPVLVLTAGHVDHRVQSLGVQQVIKKPVELSSLLSAIEKHRR